MAGAPVNIAVGGAWNDGLEAEDHRAFAARVRYPTLILVGEHDSIC